MAGMGIFLRIVQILALSGGVALFGLLAYSDPEFPPTRPMLLIGCAICGFGAMWLTTFVIVLILHGPKAAGSLEWY